VDATKELEPSSSTPDEDSPARALKKFNEALETPIFGLWKHSFETGTIPANLKSQHITPVFKKGYRSAAANTHLTSPLHI
jgi:hypothetical protein